VLAWQDRSFYTLHDLRAVGLPVLGGISGPQARPAIGPRLAFGLGLVTLPVGYGAMLAGLPGQVARLLA
jgi:hypothetical protein